MKCIVYFLQITCSSNASAGLLLPTNAQYHRCNLKKGASSCKKIKGAGNCVFFIEGKPVMIFFLLQSDFRFLVLPSEKSTKLLLSSQNIISKPLPFCTDRMALVGLLRKVFLLFPRTCKTMQLTPSAQYKYCIKKNIIHNQTEKTFFVYFRLVCL